MDQPKVLVVDDDADLRRTVSLLIEPFCRVIQACNGPEALELVRRERPSVMLLDLVMPGMDGTAVLGQARALDPKLCVIMLSGEQEIELAERALTLGASAYVTKPFDVDFLKDEVRRLLGREGIRAPEGESPPWKIAPGP